MCAISTVVQPYCPLLTSAAAPAEPAALLRGRTSLLLRWTWYTFSAGTHDRGLSSGGMVTPYSQPAECTHTHTERCTQTQFHYCVNARAYGLDLTI